MVGFHLGFTKIAAFTFHNDGSEFKVMDTEPAPYVPGVGGMAPSGIPSYKPTDTGAGKPQLTGKAAMNRRALDIAMLGKMGSQGDPRDPTAYIGTQGQGAETLVTQLKYETGYNNITEGQGYNKIKTNGKLLRRGVKK